jgi:hypothetical protein
MTKGHAIRRSKTGALLLLGVGTLALAACGGGSSPTAAPVTRGQPAQSTSATQPTTDPAAQVIAAYRTMWADFVIAAQTSDYRSPLLSQHASGEALTLLVQGLARDQLHGIVTRGETVHHPQVSSLTPPGSPNRAMVTDCFDDTHWLEYTSSGALAKNAPGGRRATTADLLEVGGTWKVSQITVAATGTC